MFKSHPKLFCVLYARWTASYHPRYTAPRQTSQKQVTSIQGTFLSPLTNALETGRLKKYFHYQIIREKCVGHDKVPSDQAIPSGVYGFYSNRFTIETGPIDRVPSDQAISGVYGF